MLMITVIKQQRTELWNNFMASLKWLYVKNAKNGVLSYRDAKNMTVIEIRGGK